MQVNDSADDSLFWDYSSSFQPAGPKPWPAPAHTGRGAPQTQSQISYNDAVLTRLTHAPAPVVPPNPPAQSLATPAPKKSLPASAGRPTQPSKSQALEVAKQLARPEALPARAGEPGLFTGELRISQHFRGWCQQQMKQLTGNDDMVLIEFLLSLRGRMEVVEYIQEYFKSAPKEQVAGFTKEFMLRKENDAVQIRREEQEMEQKRRQQTRMQAAQAAQAGRLSEVGSRAGVPVEERPVGEAQGAGWEKVKNKGNKGKGKGKKGQPKGQQVPAEMLGFRSSMGFDILGREQ